MNLRRRLYPNWKFWPFIVPATLSVCLVLIDDFAFRLFGGILFSLLAMGSVQACWNTLLVRLGRLSPEVEGVLSFLLDNEEFMFGKIADGISANKHQPYPSIPPTYSLNVKGVVVPLTTCEEILLGRIIEAREENIARLKRKSALETSSAAIDDLMRSQEIALTARLEALRARIEEKGLDSSPRNPIMAATKETQCTRSASSAAQ